MDSLFGDRFLQRFAGDILRKHKQRNPTTDEGQTPDANDGKTIPPDTNAVEEIGKKGNSEKKKEGNHDTDN